MRQTVVLVTMMDFCCDDQVEKDIRNQNELIGVVEGLHHAMALHFSLPKG